mmetsp:Transcript_27605/g.81174  ORF Transcript_27605/g.81174 Transcript_27605/m.81174 type:complete len:313 (-) Transcript_27605:838-1776(-)
MHPTPICCTLFTSFSQYRLLVISEFQLLSGTLQLPFCHQLEIGFRQHAVSAFVELIKLFVQFIQHLPVDHVHDLQHELDVIQSSNDAISLATHALEMRNPHLNLRQSLLEFRLSLLHYVSRERVQDLTHNCHCHRNEKHREKTRARFGRGHVSVSNGAGRHDSIIQASGDVPALPHSNENRPGEQHDQQKQHDPRFPGGHDGLKRFAALRQTTRSCLRPRHCAGFFIRQLRRLLSFIKKLHCLPLTFVFSRHLDVIGRVHPRFNNVRANYAQCQTEGSDSTEPKQTHKHLPRNSAWSQVPIPDGSERDHCKV